MQEVFSFVWDFHGQPPEVGSRSIVLIPGQEGNSAEKARAHLGKGHPAGQIVVVGNPQCINVADGEILAEKGVSFADVLDDCYLEEVQEDVERLMATFFWNTFNIKVVPRSQSLSPVARQTPSSLPPIVN